MSVSSADSPPPRSVPAPPEQVDRIAAAVLAVPGVADLNAGRFGEYTTYLPGRRLAGVVERGNAVTVAVTARSTQPLPALADQIRLAVAVVDDRPVEVTIADLDADL